MHQGDRRFAGRLLVRSQLALVNRIGDEATQILGHTVLYVQQRTSFDQVEDALDFLVVLVAEWRQLLRVANEGDTLQ